MSILQRASEIESLMMREQGKDKQKPENDQKQS